MHVDIQRDDHWEKYPEIRDIFATSVSDDSLTSSSQLHINGTRSDKFELLVERALSIYPNVKLEDLCRVV